MRQRQTSLRQLAGAQKRTLQENIPYSRGQYCCSHQYRFEGEKGRSVDASVVSREGDSLVRKNAHSRSECSRGQNLYSSPVGTGKGAESQVKAKVSATVRRQRGPNFQMPWLARKWGRYAQGPPITGRRFEGTMVRRLEGTMIRWHYGTMIRWYDGTMSRFLQ